MTDVNINQVVASLWDAVVSDGPTDNIFTSQALLELFGEHGFKESVSGGKQFEFTLEFAQNTSFQSISELGTVSTTAVTVFDAAQYTQKIWAGSVVFTDLEDVRNQVENRKFDVVKSKIKNAMSSATESLEVALFGDGTGNGGLDPNGLANVISATPTTGTVGGVSADTWVFWRNKQNSGAKTTTIYDNLATTWELTFNQCSLGGTTRRPTGIITDAATYRGYIRQLTAIERLVKNAPGTDSVPGADLGFENESVGFKGRPVMYSENATANLVYFLNNNFLKLCYLKGAWMKKKDPVEPANQFTRVHRIFSVVNLCAGARRHLGVVTASAS